MSTAASAALPEPPPVDARTARLVRLCEVWGKVRYLHPWVVEGAVDWDAALVAALPSALAAKTDDDAAASVRVMLDALHDPATRVERGTEATAPAADHGTRAPSSTVDGVLVLKVSAAGWQDVDAEAERIGKALATVERVVLDLRTSTWFSQLVVDTITSRLPSHEVVGLSQRVVVHHGYHPQSGVTSGGYATLLAAALPKSYPATTKPHPSRIVFLTSTAAGVPDVAWAMQASGDAAVVVQGALAMDELAATEVLPLAGGYRAHLRRAEISGPTPHPDVQLDAGTPDAKVIEAAVHAAKHGAWAKPAERTAGERRATWRPDALYADEPYPSRERRVLALFRFWNVIRHFYPYLPLMGDTWDRALVDFLPRFEAAASAREYVLAVAELAARIPDGHVNVWGSNELRDFRGAAPAPFAVRVVEGQPVVTSLLGDAGVASAGVAVGDVIVAVDGEPIAARMARLEKYVAASNETWRAYRVARAALSGAEGASVRLTLRGAGGALRDVAVPRTSKLPPPERSGPVYRLLEGGIGYADLDRLEKADVDAMFTAFDKTRAIVFDMRGYPHGTAWTIAPRLNVRRVKTGPQFFEPLVMVEHGGSSFFEQEIPPTDKPLYRGKTVMLIDERTMSQAEHTGLFFEVANGTTFIGSQTAGANGDVTNLSLPGGLFVSFSGHDVRHADGRQLQRIGLRPDVEVRPTLEGIRAGRDEVLERALAFLDATK